MEENHGNAPFDLSFQELKDVSSTDDVAVIEVSNENHQNGAQVTLDVHGNGSDEVKVIPDGKDEEMLARLTSTRLQVKRFVEHFYVRLFGAILVIVDITIIIIDISIDPQSKPGIETYDIISLIIWTYFFVEISLRIFANGKIFFQTPFPDLLDLGIVIITGTVTFTYIIADFTGANSEYGKLILACRLLRVVNVGRLISERRHIAKASRRMTFRGLHPWTPNGDSFLELVLLKVSENKRRYQKDGFDIDLTYITDQVIASSFPSSGRQSIYRNPIEEVSRFLNLKHAGHYRVCNLCSERHYDESFFNNRVYRFPIDDHNVPLLREIKHFTSTCQKWNEEDPKTIIFVHCKGGKGRTGTMICCWLLASGLYKTAMEALEHFGDRRTDLDEGTKFQGVQTPSQGRYVNYYEQVLYKLDNKIPTPRRLILKHLKIESLKGLCKGDGRDLSFVIFCDKIKVHHGNFEKNCNCAVIYDHGSDTVNCRVSNCPVLEGNVKIKFDSSAKNAPVSYDKCLFFFWFHTGFLKGNILRLTKNEIDNPHLPRNQKYYSDDFAVELRFEEADGHETVELS